VENAAKVNISDLSIDGNNNGVYAAYACGADLRGIEYQNASGTITEVSVLNENEGSGNGCQSGEGIFIESGSGHSTVKITNSVIENFQKNGITGNNIGTAVTISGNSLLAEGPATDGAAANGVQIGFGATGTVSENTSIDDVWTPDLLGDTGDAAAGILVYGSESVIITSNTVANTQYGIAVVSDSTDSLAADLAVIKSNKISGTHFYDAIEICNGNTVESNTISSSDQSAIHLDGSAANGCTQEGASNTVSGNVVNTACAGILISNNFPNNIGTNTFNNVTINLDQADTCTTSEPAAEVNARAQRAGKTQVVHRVRPVR
jgi:parallel beta-helix repeat protein